MLEQKLSRRLSRSQSSDQLQLLSQNGSINTGRNHFKRGQHFFELGQYGVAYIHLKKAISSNYPRATIYLILLFRWHRRLLVDTQLGELTQYTRLLTGYLSALQEKTLENDSEACYLLGVCRQNGLGIQQDEKIALEWYQLAAKRNHSAAQNELGKIYKAGKTVAMDIPKAIEWFSKASANGDPNSRYHLAKLYLKGKDVKKDVPKGIAILQELAKLGLVNARYRLARCYALGKLLPKNVVQAFEYYLSGAQHGHLESQYYLGECYLSGQGIDKDMALAFHWCLQASERGHRNATFYLAELVHKGLTDFPVDAAESWYLKAAGKGCGKSQNNLAVFYSEKTSRWSKNYRLLRAKQTNWFQLAAANGFGLPKENLEQGGATVIVSLDDAKKLARDTIDNVCLKASCAYDAGDYPALLIYSTFLASHGHCLGSLFLYQIFYQGLGVKHDHCFAQFYRNLFMRQSQNIKHLIAEKDVMAHYVMGLCYQTGCFTQKADLNEAAHYFHFAVQQNFIPALFALAKIAEQMRSENGLLLSMEKRYDTAARLGYQPAVDKLASHQIQNFQVTADRLPQQLADQSIDKVDLMKHCLQQSQFTCWLSALTLPQKEMSQELYYYFTYQALFDLIDLNQQLNRQSKNVSNSAESKYGIKSEVGVMKPYDLEQQKQLFSTLIAFFQSSLLIKGPENQLPMMLAQQQKQRGLLHADIADLIAERTIALDLNAIVMEHSRTEEAIISDLTQTDPVKKPKDTADSTQIGDAKSSSRMREINQMISQKAVADHMLKGGYEHLPLLSQHIACCRYQLSVSEHEQYPESLFKKLGLTLLVTNEIRAKYHDMTSDELFDRGMQALNLNNYELAKSFFVLLARRDHYAGHFYLAIMYKHGRGVTINKKHSEAWGVFFAHKTSDLELGLSQGDVTAQFLKGDILFQNYHTGSNQSDAIKLFQQAAEQGCLHARYRLAQCFERGIVGQPDPKKASLHYIRAVNQLYLPASEALKKLFKTHAVAPGEAFSSLMKPVTRSIIKQRLYMHDTDYVMALLHLPIDRFSPQVMGYLQGELLFDLLSLLLPATTDVNQLGNFSNDWRLSPMLTLEMLELVEGHNVDLFKYMVQLFDFDFSAKNQQGKTMLTLLEERYAVHQISEDTLKLITEYAIKKDSALLESVSSTTAHTQSHVLSSNQGVSTSDSKHATTSFSNFSLPGTSIFSPTEKKQTIDERKVDDAHLPLHRVIRQTMPAAKKIKIMESLLRINPSNLYSKNALGQRPIDMAVVQGDGDMVRYLLSKGSFTDAAELLSEALHNASPSPAMHQ